MSDYAALIERLEKLEGTVPDAFERRSLAVLATELVGDPGIKVMFSMALSGGISSIGAAVALVERLLPTWCGDIDIGASQPMQDGIYGARLFNQNGDWCNHAGEGATPAIALLIAVLKALQETSENER